MNFLAELLSSQVRAEIFQLLFDGKKTSLYLREIHRRSGLAIGTIQQEIAHLKKMDLIQSEKDGNRTYFTAQTNHPLYNEICGLVEKTSGVAERLREALSELKDIQCVFIFGSFAKGTEKSHSDIDLIVIGNISLRALSTKLKNISEQSQREINPHIYSLKTWKDKLKKKDHFIKTILGENKIFLIGNSDVLK